MKLDEIKAALARRRADFEGWGLNPDLAGGYAVITAIHSNAPFKVGEILALGGEHAREIGGDGTADGRKPSKWDLDYEWFGTDYDAAWERAALLSKRPTEGS